MYPETVDLGYIRVCSRSKRGSSDYEVATASACSVATVFAQR